MLWFQGSIKLYPYNEGLLLPLLQLLLFENCIELIDQLMQYIFNSGCAQGMYFVSRMCSAIKRRISQPLNVICYHQSITEHSFIARRNEHTIAKDTSLISFFPFYSKF